MNFYAWMQGFPRAKVRSRDIIAEHGLRVPMHDGVELIADRYHPRGDDKSIVMLIRSPYGRGIGFAGMAKALAGQGYQVLLQSTRGTHDSGGVFEPGVAEPADGLATVEWMRRQPWFPGAFVTYGPSYLGYVQWALAMNDAPEWRAAVIGVAPSDWSSGYTHVGGVLSLQRALTWIYGLEPQTVGRGSVLGQIRRSLTQAKTVLPIAGHLPVKETDRLILGHEVAHFQRWVASDGDEDEYAAQVDFRRGAEHLPPVHLTAGWHDFFLATMLTDYVALRRAGRTVRLLVGPGKHESGNTRTSSPEQLVWLDHYGRGEKRPPIHPVRVHVLGAGRWADLDDWPPPDSIPTAWHLKAGGGLARSPATEAGPSRYRYDPADPTPNVGGWIVDVPWRGGAQDNRRLEARSDVLTFTTEPLERDLEIIGWVDADLFVRSSLEHTDFFARLCDVDAKGRSMNICDGLVRLRPGSTEPDAEGVRRLKVAMAGTAYRFRRGHRIRLQVSSGAHPRYTRNLGTGEPVAEATAMRAADQEIFHGPERPSTLLLPLRNGTARPGT